MTSIYPVNHRQTWNKCSMQNTSPLSISFAMSYRTTGTLESLVGDQLMELIHLPVKVG